MLHFLFLDLQNYLCDQGLQKPLHSQGADFKTLGVPFQQDGGGGGRHGLCWKQKQINS